MIGGAVAELLAVVTPTPMRILGIAEFAPVGTTEFLLDHFGLNAGGIAKTVRDLIGNR